ncbi:MAG: alpha/beta fold hydrolase, partial [Sphingomonadaceae bacterium]
GLSSGRPRNGAGHIDRFETWLDDLAQMLPWAEEALGGPVIPLGHSMGGHLLLRHLVADPRSVPAAILTAPFCGFVQPLAASRGLARLARLMVRLGRGTSFAPGQKPFGAYRMATGRMALLTSDPEQFADEGRWVAANPALATGGVSWGWLAAAHASLKALRAAPLERCSTPILMLLAGRERLVSNAAAWRIARRLPACRVETLPEAAHEILRESDPVRAHALSLVADFAARRAA